MELTITRVFRKDVETRFGIKPKLSIQTNEYGEKWLSTFNTKGTEGWSEGMTVKADVQEKGDFINFKPLGVASTTSSTGSNVATPDLAMRVSKLEHAVFGPKDVDAADKEPSIQTEETEDADGAW